MQIFVLQTWNGHVESLEVEPSDTIGNIKSKISAKLRISTEDMILLYKEQPLQDSYTLLELGIPKQAILHLQLRLRGLNSPTKLLCML